MRLNAHFRIDPPQSSLSFPLASQNYSPAVTTQPPLEECTGNSYQHYQQQNKALYGSSAMSGQLPLPTGSTASIPTRNHCSLGPSSIDVSALSSIQSSLPPKREGFYPSPSGSGSALSYGRGSLRHRRDATRYMRLRQAISSSSGTVLPYINPIYLSPQFQQYRHKQESREDKTAQIWTDSLENWFLDAILLMPHMGRRKFMLNGIQHGRNMLIMEYLWIAYQSSLRPGEMLDHEMRRDRKKVSSHIQVLRNFFGEHRCCK